MRRLRALVVPLLVVAVALTCVRLGFWQLSRWQDKRELNTERREALATPPVEVPDAGVPLARFSGRRVIARGEYDESRQVLLSSRWHAHEPGVEVVTPLRMWGGTALLVDRGWLPATDQVHGDPLAHPEPGARTLTGLLEPLAAPKKPEPWRVLASKPSVVWSTWEIAPDSLRAHFPYPVAPWLLRALPESGASSQPLRAQPEALDEKMHLSYAIQWFSFALILLVGSWALSRRGRARA